MSPETERTYRRSHGLQSPGLYTDEISVCRNGSSDFFFPSVRRIRDEVNAVVRISFSIYHDAASTVS